jgi:SAM-dependent methyltransferase
MPNGANGQDPTWDRGVLAKCGLRELTLSANLARLLLGLKARRREKREVFMDWSEGYVTDIGYVRGYYPALSPLYQSFVLANTGFEPPSLEAPFTKVELGCGYGLSLLVEAAAHPNGQFYGVDFNPGHIAWAKRAAADAQLENAHFFELSFADLLSSPIPDADFVSLHGVWSWVSQANRDAIKKFLGQRLKSGGLAMVSYNVLPGWSVHEGLRELLMRKYRSISGTTESRIDQAFKFATDMQKAGAALFVQHPNLVTELADLATKSKSYLAHEYFNSDWRLFFQHEVAEDLADIRLSFVGIYKAIENHERYNFSAAVIELLNQVSASERETLKDLTINRKFRYDLYGRGLERVPHIVAAEHVLNSNFILVDNVSKFASGTFKTHLGPIQIKPELYEGILKRLSAGQATGRELIMQPGQRVISPSQLVELMAILIDTGIVSLAMPKQNFGDRSARARRLNETFIRRSMKGQDCGFLLSPVTGFAHQINDIHQMFILAAHQQKDPVPFAWSALKSVGRRISRKGVFLEKEEENIEEVEKRFATYEKDVKPLFTQLAIVG